MLQRIPLDNHILWLKCEVSWWGVSQRLKSSCGQRKWSGCYISSRRGFSRIGSYQEIRKKSNLRPHKICGNESNKNTLVRSVQMSQAFSCLPDYQPHPIKLPQPPTPQGLFQDLLHQSFSPNCGSEVDTTLTTRQTSGFDKGGLISKWFLPEIRIKMPTHKKLIIEFKILCFFLNSPLNRIFSNKQVQE